MRVAAALAAAACLASSAAARSGLLVDEQWQAAMEARMAHLEARLALAERASETLCACAGDAAGDAAGAGQARTGLEQVAARSSRRDLRATEPSTGTPSSEARIAESVMAKLPASSAVQSLGLGSFLTNGSATGLAEPNPADDALVIEQEGAAMYFAASPGADQGAGALAARLRAQVFGPLNNDGYNHTSVLETLTGSKATRVEPAPAVLVSSAAVSAPNVAAMAAALAGVAEAVREAVANAPRLAAVPGELRAFACEASKLPTGWVLADGRCLRVSAVPSLFEAIGVTWTPNKLIGCAANSSHATNCEAGDPVVWDGVECGVGGYSACGLDAQELLPAWAPNRTFCVPDLRSRSAIGSRGDYFAADAVNGDECVKTGSCSPEDLLHSSTVMPAAPGLFGRATAEVGGTQFKTLTAAHLPPHNHQVVMNEPRFDEFLFKPASGAYSTQYCKNASGCDTQGAATGVPGDVLQPYMATTSTGGGSQFSIEPPFVAVTWAIFTGSNVQRNVLPGSPPAVL
uniref:Uncharacterized protein n=2 Tax=Cafeteria roenbergensis TaxID=33653 RepID=A0A7S0JXY3_CAFRO|mmetsp:Transcript_20624/g.79159  ORF Transcript_20624/g.79159 Transcript_20624/m.79159 type:complete len:517 (+) Transcript_20624:258-1808(+)